ncbi:MAG TPA: hypothetical protein VK618_01660 [Flavitalea sp.]|nr:hypothetical protein [Flavitalea sp.]
MKITLNAESITMPAYLRVVPNTFDEKKKYPVLIFLHGIGESGDETLGFDGLGKLAKRMTESWMFKGLTDKVDQKNFIAYFPQADNSPQSIWQNNEYGRLRDFVEKEPFVDTDQIAVGGLSMGAIGTLSILYSGNDNAILRNSCYLIICGGYRTDDASNIKLAEVINRLNLPVWAWSGGKDTASPGNPVDDFVLNGKTYKGVVRKIWSRITAPNAKLSLWMDKGHDIWDDVFVGAKPTEGFTESVEDWSDWMLRQRKGKPQGFKTVVDAPPVIEQKPPVKPPITIVWPERIQVAMANQGPIIYGLMWSDGSAVEQVVKDKVNTFIDLVNENGKVRGSISHKGGGTQVLGPYK